MIDLNKSPLSALVAEFNKLTGKNVKRFPDRKTAVKRLSEVMPKAKPKKQAQPGKGGRTPGSSKREQLVEFIKVTPRTIEEICNAFEIKPDTASSYLSYIANPKYCGKALGRPVEVHRTEEGLVYA